MNPLRFAARSLTFVIACSLCSVGCQQMKEATGVSPSIRGNYVLDYRELPNGQRVRSPDVMGMMSFTRDTRNFNVYWTQDGKPVSVSTIPTRRSMRCANSPLTARRNSPCGRFLFATRIARSP